MTDRLQDATLRMRGGDWAAMALVACVVGLYCAGELRDIKLCQLTFEQRDGASAPAWVRGVLFALIALRQYAFLPNVVHIVAMLVIHRGSDAISICFNALAVLFLLGDATPAGGGHSTPSVFDSGLVLEILVFCGISRPGRELKFTGLTQNLGQL